MVQFLGIKKLEVNSEAQNVDKDRQKMGGIEESVYKY